MEGINSAPEVVYDQYFRSSNKHKPHNPSKHVGSTEAGESINDDLDMKKLWKEIRCLGTSTMSWKERKKLEEQQLVRQGGRAPKKQRIPLSVAKGQMKKQKKREQKQLEEALILGQFMKKPRGRKEVKRKPEDMVLRATEGHFKGGVLNVRHLLRQNPPKSNEVPRFQDTHKGGKNGKGKGRGRGKHKGKHSRH